MVEVKSSVLGQMLSSLQPLTSLDLLRDEEVSVVLRCPEKLKRLMAIHVFALFSKQTIPLGKDEAFSFLRGDFRSA